MIELLRIKVKVYTAKGLDIDDEVWALKLKGFIYANTLDEFGGLVCINDESYEVLETKENTNSVTKINSIYDAIGGDLNTINITFK